MVSDVNERTSGQDTFRSLLLMVVGQAYQAADYVLDHAPMQWAGGRYRFSRALDADFMACLEYQVLIYTDTSYAVSTPSRFRVTLTRSNAPAGRFSPHPRYATRSLSALVTEDFGVAILPQADYWWTYTDTTTLGQALAEAGHLVIGYGMPWLSGDLLPPTR